MVFIKAFKLNFGKSQWTQNLHLLSVERRKSISAKKKKYCFKKSFINPAKVK